MGEEVPPEVQEGLEGERQVQELLECPEHVPDCFIKGKPQSILSLPRFIKNNLSLFMFDALSYRCCLEPLMHISFPCLDIYIYTLLPLFRFRLEIYAQPCLDRQKSDDFLSPTSYRWISGHGWLYLLSWKLTMWCYINGDRAGSYMQMVLGFVMLIPSVSVKNCVSPLLQMVLCIQATIRTASLQLCSRSEAAGKAFFSILSMLLLLDLIMELACNTLGVKHAFNLDIA